MHNFWSKSVGNHRYLILLKMQFLAPDCLALWLHLYHLFYSLLKTYKEGNTLSITFLFVDQWSLIARGKHCM